MLSFFLSKTTLGYSERQERNGSDFDVSLPFYQPVDLFCLVPSAVTVCQVIVWAYNEGDVG
jgi:hypothetical protein